MRREIEYLDESWHGRHEPTLVVYVGGPRAGSQEVLYGAQPPAALLVPAEHGVYQRSVRCADDEGLRYVWVSDDGG